MDTDISSIIKMFDVKGQFSDTQPYGTGHLHDTYRVGTDQKGTRAYYILQRINHKAFGDPRALMENIVRITGHMEEKLKMRYRGEGDISRRVLRVIPTVEGENYYRDERGNYWRVYDFIADTRSYDIVHDRERLFQVAYMFGEFLDLLQDLPGPQLHETIRDFHNGQKRLKALEEAIKRDDCNRSAMAGGEIDFVMEHAGVFDVVPELLEKGEIRVRVTHNDTKVNNVLLDKKSGKGVCVIDLDTAMPGVALYDFGDLVRTALSTKAEDERDLSGVAAETRRFKVLLEGFLAGAGDSLAKGEKNQLLLGAKLMTLLIGMRFLTDYLKGDIYFKIHREGHNLDRCRRQFKLLQSIMEHQGEMEKVVEDFILL
ncbi:MAG: aminoglycoside phosphotransferase family protein [bacterium]|nr:aminoglycoside phosphotransferase family protein [bacterium]